jgi:hypothetical protein
VALGSTSTWCPGGDSQRSACRGVFRGITQISWEYTREPIKNVKSSFSQRMSDYDIMKMYENVISCKKQTPFAKFFGEKTSNIEQCLGKNII